MSKFEGIKKFFGKTACSIGIHKWDNWVYITKTTCDQRAVCLRCNKEGHRFSHDWSDWFFVEASSCDQVMKCNHCGESQSRIVHNWSDWVYEPHDNRYCLKSRECMRCGEIDSKTVSHSWSSWKEYLSGDIRECRKCGFQEIAPSHDWGTWKEYKDSWGKDEDPVKEALSGGDKRKCSRCGKEEKYPEHDWTEWKAVFSDKSGVKCNRCGKKVTLSD